MFHVEWQKRQLAACTGYREWHSREKVWLYIKDWRVTAITLETIVEPLGQDFPCTCIHEHWDGSATPDNQRSHIIDTVNLVRMLMCIHNGIKITDAGIEQLFS